MPTSIKRGKDLTGKTFDKLTVIAPTDKRSKRGAIIWKCLCRCGKEIEMAAENLKRPYLRSCPKCVDKTRPKRIKDISGLKSGKLTVLYLLPERDVNNRAFWLCECECGNKLKIRSQSLIRKESQSCGCIFKIISPANGKKGRNKISGPLSHLYKETLSEEDRIKRRSSPKLTEWRRNVFLRDNYTCDNCKKKGAKIVAHHLDGWAKYKEERYNINNGIVLCKMCHKQFHSFMGGERISCKKEDYYGWKNTLTATEGGATLSERREIITKEIKK
jgi:ribosomal protein L32